MQEYRNTTATGTYKAPAVRQRKKRSALNLYLTVGVAIIAALGSLMSVNVFFNLDAANVEINGISLYTAEQIQYVGGIAQGQNLIRLNTDFIANRLKRNLVYVDDVTVEKKYPDKLIVNITEAKEAAEIEADGGYCTLSESGRVLERTSERRSEKLPLVVGYELISTEPGAAAESEDTLKTGILTSLFKEMKAVNMDKIVRIDLTDRTDIRLMYDNRIEIRLGSSVDLDIKLTYIKTVLDSQLPDSYEGTLRYNGIESGISAIPKQAEVPTKPASTSSSSDSSADESSAADAYGEDGLTDSSTDTPNGYGDDYGYEDYSDDYNYDYNTDYNYDYNYDYDTDYNYDYNYDYDTDYNYNYDYNTDYNYDYGYDEGYGY